MKQHRRTLTACTLPLLVGATAFTLDVDSSMDSSLSRRRPTRRKSSSLVRSLERQAVRSSPALAPRGPVRHRRSSRRSPCSTSTGAASCRACGRTITSSTGSASGSSAVPVPRVLQHWASASEIQSDRRSTSATVTPTPNSLECRNVRAVSLCQGNEGLANEQLAARHAVVWYVAPQITVVPFRGKFSLFGAAFLDSGHQHLRWGLPSWASNERADCEAGNVPGLLRASSEQRARRHRYVRPRASTSTPVWNNRQDSWLGFGAEFRGTPFVMEHVGLRQRQRVRTASPDDAVNGERSVAQVQPDAHRAYVSFQLPAEIEVLGLAAKQSSPPSGGHVAAAVSRRWTCCRVVVLFQCAGVTLAEGEAVVGAC